jgi:glycosyltransferase involved in cell wall biosynthesis
VANAKCVSQGPERSVMKVAFVVQRCGREVVGGAESHCLQVAQRMAKYWRTEVLTTCALDYMEWRNHYPEGTEKIGDTVVRRFPVDHPRDIANFNAFSSELASRQAAATLAEQEQWMRAQGPVSTPLLEYLRSAGSNYDFFIFFGYLYATTYFGLPVVKDKAFLAPLAHDEWPIHFTMWDKWFSQPQGFFFNTTEERAFLARRFPAAKLAGPVVGIGIESPSEPDPEGFRQKYDLAEPFLLYVGRIDASKGCGEMFDAFIRFRNDGRVAYKLVLVGKEVLPVPYHPDIVYLGVVPEDEKWNAMSACDWLLAPSPYESLSMVLLETWTVGRPAIVTAASEVLVGHCQRSNGGVWFKDYEECAAILGKVDDTMKKILGQQGQRYVRENYSWARIETIYLDELGALRDRQQTQNRPPSGPQLPRERRRRAT